MALEKAEIKIFGQTEETVQVMFNPSEYSIDGSNQYAFHKVPGLDQPIAQFISGEATKFTMELFFDTYETKQSVKDQTDKLAKLLKVNAHLHAPPVCEFSWGGFSFQGILESMTQKFTMFLETGVPVRARLNVTFREYQTFSQQLQPNPRESADRTKQRTIRQGEQLWTLASSEYEDPAAWRAIAKANNIDNPRVVETGRKLVLPSLE